MKSSLKTKISHLFKGKSNKLEKFPTYDTSSSRTLENQTTPRSIETEKVHGNKKSHKKAKTNLNLIDTKVKRYNEFPVLPSPIHDPNESAKLTAQEFAKAVGIKILHRTDEEEDEECDCEYCRSAHYNSANLNTISTIDPSLIDEASTPTQQIPNVSLNQLSVTNASISSATNSNASTINDSQNINIPPFPAFNMSFSNDRLNKCSSNASISTNSNHSIINSKTIGTPGYHCQRNNRKNSISKVIDMSLFIPPTEEEIKGRVHSSSLSINSTPETNTIQPCASTEKFMGGSLDRNRNVGYKKNYYGIGVASSMSTRERSISTSAAANSNRNNMRMMNSEYRTSPILKESSIGHSSRIQFKQQQPFHRCDSGTELSNGNASTSINTNVSGNGNANGNPSSPNKRPYPSSLASSSSSTTLSSALSLTHITQSNLNQIPSSQSCSSRSSISKGPISHNNSIQSVKYSPKPSNASTPAGAMSPASSYSSITPIKPHSSFKITRSVTISEGTRRAEIDLQPIQQDEIKVYTKGRFTITCEHSRRPSIQSYPSNN